ncbi:hypothetical protein [Jeotgalibaca porci]|uniref:hypothetical protein n=1 Tax=Jeotgalibaca porci TaxID=1868793 RepID=UPI00359F288E
MADIKIQVKRSGFPVNIGEVELFFDSSQENLKQFFNVDTIAKEKMDALSEKAKSVKVPNEINESNVRDIDPKTIETAFDVNKEFIAIQYDLIFGDGAFERLYNVYPDINALTDVLEAVGISIAEKLEEENKKRQEKSTLKLTDHLSKKASKK